MHYKLAPTKRFSNRVINYVKYRPHYPKEIIEYLTNKMILRKRYIIADIGSGTGILTKLFLENKNIVYGIEPNKEMRIAGEKYLEKYHNFISTNGQAEKTKLKSKSIDLITAGQAFHWFKVAKAKAEFLRILKPGGYVVLIWNTKYYSTPFLKAYHKLLLTYGTDYKKVRHEEVGKNILSKFFRSRYYIKNFYNEQSLDFKGLKGRLLSSSYIPLADNPVYNKMISDLKKIFETYQIENKVIFKYNTKIFWGKIN